MRTRARTDANQTEIVTALRKAGAFVQSLASIGDGCPDLLVSYRGEWMLFEVKDGDKPPAQRKVTDDEIRWHLRSNGRVYMVESAEQAIRFLETK